MNIINGKYNVVLLDSNGEPYKVLATFDTIDTAIEYMRKHYRKNIDLISPIGRFSSWVL